MKEENKDLKALESELKDKVTVKIVSSRGHDEFEDSPAAALARVQDETTTHGKWAYLDGRQVNPVVLTIDDILAADDITLTNALVGG